MPAERIDVVRGWAVDRHPPDAGAGNPMYQPALHPTTGQPAWMVVRPYGPDFPPFEIGAGTAGGGKTNLIRFHTIRMLNLPDTLGIRVLALADGKDASDGQGRSSFEMFRGQPGILGPVSGTEHLWQLLCTLHTLADQRMGDFRRATLASAATGDVPEYAFPTPIYVTLDEYNAFIHRLDRIDTSRAAQVEMMLFDILSVAREVQIFPSLWMHRPDAATFKRGLPGPVKALATCRTAVPGAMGFDSMESRMLFDATGYARLIPGLPRSGLMKIGRYVARFQTPYIHDACSPDASTTKAQRDATWALLPGGRAAYRPADPRQPAEPPKAADMRLPPTVEYLKEMWDR